MRTKYLQLVVVTAVAVVAAAGGCGGAAEDGKGDDGGADAGLPPLPELTLENYCEVTAPRWCEMHRPCCESDGVDRSTSSPGAGAFGPVGPFVGGGLTARFDRQACEEEYRLNCESDVAATRAGMRTFHPERHAECEVELSAALESCAGNGSTPACQRVFNGTIEEGQQCAAGVEETAACRLPEGADVIRAYCDSRREVCAVVRRGSEGAPCGFEEPDACGEALLCAVPGAPCEPGCSDEEPPAPGSFPCEPGCSGPESGSCVSIYGMPCSPPNRAPGARCDDSGTWVPAGSAGDPCSGPDDCGGECEEVMSEPSLGPGPLCSEGSDCVCVELTFPSVLIETCEGRIRCGGVACPAGSSSCCTQDETCGFSIDGIERACVPLDDPGAIDPECPLGVVSIAQFGGGAEQLLGCCRPDSTCGFDFGGACVERSVLGHPSVACTPPSCGGVTCDVTAAEVRLPICCTEDTGECGVEFPLFDALGVPETSACVAPRPPGRFPSTCPVADNGRYLSCCAASGECGVESGSVFGEAGLGCIEVSAFGLPPVSCDPTTGDVIP